MNYKLKITNFLKHPFTIAFASNIFNSILVIILSSLVIGLMLHIKQSSDIPAPENIKLTVNHLFAANTIYILSILFMLFLAHFLKISLFIYVFNSLAMDMVALATGAAIGLSYTLQEDNLVWIIASVISFLIMTSMLSSYSVFFQTEKRK